MHVGTGLLDGFERVLGLGGMNFEGVRRPKKLTGWGVIPPDPILWGVRTPVKTRGDKMVENGPTFLWAWKRLAW